MTDKEILALFKLDNYKLVKEVPLDDRNTIYLHRDGRWVHIMDNYFYSLWHQQSFREQINELGEKYEIFSCTAGDVDKSFDFKYYKNGKKIREYVVASPNYNDQVIKVDIGEPLFGESKALQNEDELNKILCVAEQLGIVLPKNADQILIYKKEE